MKKQMLIAILLVLMAACGGGDPYADKFQTQIAIGDTRSHVVEIMGPPNTVNSIEVPILRGERLTWKAANGRTYQIFTAMDHVVSKSVIQ